MNIKLGLWKEESAPKIIQATKYKQQPRTTYTFIPRAARTHL